MKSRCVLVVSQAVDLCGLYEYALTSAGFAVLRSATLPAEPTDADVIVVHLHPRADKREISSRLRLFAPQAALIALTSVRRDAQPSVFEIELLLPVSPDSLVEIVSALNRESA